jgi:hypothetical protein
MRDLGISLRPITAALASRLGHRTLAWHTQIDTKLDDISYTLSIIAFSVPSA